MRVSSGSLGEPVFGRTDSHLLLYDLTSLGIRGHEAEKQLEAARILANRNQIPADQNSPWSPSGLRFGTTVPTILGYSDVDVRRLGAAVGSVLTAARNPKRSSTTLLHTYHSDVISLASG